MKNLIVITLLLMTSQMAFAERLVHCQSKDQQIDVIFDEHITPSIENLGGDAIYIKEVEIGNLRHSFPNNSGDSTYDSFSVEVYRYVDDLGNRPPITVYVGYLDGKSKDGKWKLSFREKENDRAVPLSCN